MQMENWKPQPKKKRNCDSLRTETDLENIIKLPKILRWCRVRQPNDKWESNIYAVRSQLLLQHQTNFGDLRFARFSFTAYASRKSQPPTKHSIFSKPASENKFFFFAIAPFSCKRLWFCFVILNFMAMRLWWHVFRIQHTLYSVGSNFAVLVLSPLSSFNSNMRQSLGRL